MTRNASGKTQDTGGLPRRCGDDPQVNNVGNAREEVAP